MSGDYGQVNETSRSSVFQDMYSMTAEISMQWRNEGVGEGGRPGRSPRKGRQKRNLG